MKRTHVPPFILRLYLRFVYRFFLLSFFFFLFLFYLHVFDPFFPSTIFNPNFGPPLASSQRTFEKQRRKATVQMSEATELLYYINFLLWNPAVPQKLSLYLYEKVSFFFISQAILDGVCLKCHCSTMFPFKDRHACSSNNFVSSNFETSSGL